MSDPDQGSDHESHSKREVVGHYLKLGFTKGKENITKGALKSKLAMEHAVGLGHRPNVVPPDNAEIKCEPREVQIGWHPVGGVAGKWFAEQTKLGKLITEKVKEYPDPTQHWAVLVGGYVHELWMDEHLDVIYINEKLDREGWHTFDVGHTTFNDEALRQASEMTIYHMRQKQAGYNLISNNCQNFAVNLLSAIQIGKHREFGTAFAVYQRATGKGLIKDLFIPDPSDPQQQQESSEDLEDHIKPFQRHDTVQVASDIMDQNTTKLDGQHSL